MELKDKYRFRPYSEDFPKMFTNERERLSSVLGDNIQIEHVGSTAVPGLGGKGVIDILVIAPKEKWNKVSADLNLLGYEYRKQDPDRERERLFFQTNLPDNQLGTRLYHVHLTYPESLEGKRMIGFRDHLKENPKAVSEYAKIKDAASKTVKNLATKDEMKIKYGKIKEGFIERIIARLNIN